MAEPHGFTALAFAENLSLRDLAASYPEARRTPHELWYAPGPGEGTVHLYPFGAVVFHDVDPARREQELDRLREARPGLDRGPSFREQLAVRVEPDVDSDVRDGVLVIDVMSPARASIIGLILAQSVAMEYYESIVDALFADTDRLVDRLEESGTVGLATRPLHRFIGAAVGTRNEVLSVLHLLDKPDAAWDDPGIDRIYLRLRGEFDLADRYHALEAKLRSVQEGLELVLDVARDRRLVLLEVAIVALFLFEIVFSLLRP